MNLPSDVIIRETGFVAMKRGAESHDRINLMTVPFATFLSVLPLAVPIVGT